MRTDPQRETIATPSRKFLKIVILIFLVIAIRLFYLQVIKGEEYREKSTRNSLKESVVKTLRGKIYDRNGLTLATNTTGYKLVYTNLFSISKQDYENLKKVDSNNNLDDEVIKNNDKNEKIIEINSDIKDLLKITNLSYLDVLDKIYKTVPTNVDKVIIIDEEIPEKIALLNIETITNDKIDIIEYDKRYYPNGKLASHIIGNVKLISEEEYNSLKDKGYVKDDLIGKKGIEKQYDEIMRGVYGREYVEVDARGNIIERIDKNEAKQGANIYLSIDTELQKYMTDLYYNKYGAFIAMEVETGKIITMVSSPEIDLNVLSSRISTKDWDALVNSKEMPLVNKTISGLFPPGSIFKVVSGAAILEGGISETETMYSTGSYIYSGVTFRDSHRNGHGTTNFYKAIEESVNTYFYQFIRKIDRDLFFDIASDFNIGKKSGIDIPNELSGVLPTPEWKKNRFKNKKDQVWLPGDLINMSIGQGYLLVTPIQMVNIYQAIANNGVMLTPQLVDKIDYSGNIVEISPKITKKLKLSDKTLKILQKALELPVKGSNGTAKILNLPFVKVSAKTGTAQNSSINDHSWMAGYFPSEKPKIAFVALVQGGGYGGVTAGAKVRDFITKYYEIENSRKELNEK